MQQIEHRAGGDARVAPCGRGRPLPNEPLNFIFKFQTEPLPKELSPEQREGSHTMAPGRSVAR